MDSLTNALALSSIPAIMSLALVNNINHRDKSSSDRLSVEDTFQDAHSDSIDTVSRSETFERSEMIYKISYKLALGLPKGGDTFSG
jgi:hypothetical protein